MNGIASAKFAAFASAMALLCTPALGDSSLSVGQLEAAERVFVGMASCDAKQQVTLLAVAGQPGHFKLTHKKTVATLVTQETTSGAVRLADAKSGLLWIQIPAKSMLMNTRLGQRLADACTTPEQALASLKPDPAQPSVIDWGVPDPVAY